MSKPFLAVGNHLINPDLLAYAIIESEGDEARLRLEFASGFAETGGELQLVGETARGVALAAFERDILDQVWRFCRNQ